MRIPFTFTAGLVAATLLGACSSLQSSDNFLGFITPYRVEVVQGNVLTKEQVALIKPGQTRAQVRDVLGSPLLTDKLKSISAQDLPSERDFVASIDTLKKSGKPPALALTPEEIKALPIPPKPEAAASAPEGAQRPYPPLEPRT